MVRALVILLSVLLSSCQLFHITEILDTAERQLAEHPDSALTTMRSIRRFEVLKPQVRARYGVLYSAVLDKNYIDIASDSLIRFSADYYDLYGTPEQRMRAYYYLGRTQENAGQILPATLSFLDAAQYSDRVDDNYLKGLLYSQLGDIYSKQHNSKKAYEYSERSYNYYKVADMPRHQAYQLYRMGCLNNYLKNISLAEKHLTQAKELAIASDFSELVTYCNTELLGTYTLLEKFDKAYELLQQIDLNYYTNSVNSTLISAIITLDYKGEKERAKELLNRGWELAKNGLDSCNMHFCLSRIHFFNKKYTDCIRETIIWNNLNTTWTIKNMITTDARDLENELLERKSQFIQAKARRIKITLVVLIILISVVFIGGFIYKHITTKRKESELTRKLESNIAHLEDIRHNFDSQSQEISKMLHNMSANQYMIFDDLCNTYYERNSGAKLQISIYNKVQELIDTFSHDAKTLANIENIINTCHNNAMEKLRSEITFLKDDDYKILCYIFAGFSNQAIAVFINSEAGAVATRKSRLKSKIINANTQSKELFASLFT